MHLDTEHYFSRLEQCHVPGAKPDFSEFNCSHTRRPGQFTTTVLMRTTTIVMPDSIPLCRKCFTAYLNKYSTLCGACGELIFPGEHVAERPVKGNPNAIVHRVKKCCLYEDNWCGTWGQGRLISLHELQPELFPEGSRRANVLKAIHGDQCFMGFGNNS